MKWLARLGLLSLTSLASTFLFMAGPDAPTAQADVVVCVGANCFTFAPLPTDQCKLPLMPVVNTDLACLRAGMAPGNTGSGNSGFGNSGTANSGFVNVGSGNSGFGNVGVGNSGRTNANNPNVGVEVKVVKHFAPGTIVNTTRSNIKRAPAIGTDLGPPPPAPKCPPLCAGVGNTGVGNSGFGTSGVGNSGFGRAARGPSGRDPIPGVIVKLGR